MGRVIVVQFTTIDGVVEDPDGSDGTDFGGWAMRHGPQGVAGDKFRLGPILDAGTLLFGRRTWEHFSTLWPVRHDPFSDAMNRATKAVAASARPDLSAWSNSHHVDGPLASWTRTTKESVDIVVIGSGSVVTHLADEGLVDEYRLLVFPTVTGAGRRLFTAPHHFDLHRSEQVGPAVLTILTNPERADRDPGVIGTSADG
jgi:dihydrofolate reductase